MIDWLRRVDPGFYDKEPYLLGSQAEVPRYSEDAQAEARLRVLRSDRLLQTTITIVALSAYATATAFGTLDPHTEWAALWAFAVLAIALPRALPWWPNDDVNATWRHALMGGALIALSMLWSGVGWILALTALLGAASLFVARGRAVVLTLAAGVLFVHLYFLAPIATVLVAAGAAVAVNLIARTWRLRPQLVTWLALGALLISCAYAFSFAAPALVLRLPAEIAAIGIAYVGVCIVAVRIRRAEIIARPEGLLSLPQSIVPLLDRSHHHAIICWYT
ncbi:MAG TPA: hypothetical protein VKT72_08455 [Candidatus Baltobacteraceae bacterium]|nr:hypothetical protein [Candidatus Baltobacteraceae bacterium]